MMRRPIDLQLFLHSREAGLRLPQPPQFHVKLFLTILFCAPLLLAAAEPEPSPLTIDKIGGSGHNAP